MIKQKTKEFLEQLRSKENESNNVAKVSVEENAVENTNTRSITQEDFTDEDEVLLKTYAYQTTPETAEYVEVLADKAMLIISMQNSACPWRRRQITLGLMRKRLKRGY